MITPIAVEVTDVEAEPDPVVVVPREAAVRRLMELDAGGLLTGQDVQLAAAGLGVSPRTMWRWIG